MILFYYYKKGQTDRQTDSGINAVFVYYRTIKIKIDETTLPSVTFTVFAEQIVDRLGFKCGKKVNQ